MTLSGRASSLREPCSAKWAPPHLIAAEDVADLGKVAVEVGAGLSGHVHADGVDDELCPLRGVLSIAVDTGGALGDQLTSEEFDFLSLDLTAGDTGARLREASNGTPQVKLDEPVVPAFPEVEAMPVDGSFPLFGVSAAVAGYGYARFGVQPGLQFLLLSVALPSPAEGLRGVPGRLDAGAASLGGLATLFGVLGAAATEPVVVLIAVRQPWVARTSAALTGGN